MKGRLYVALYGFADVTAKKSIFISLLYRPSKSYDSLQVSARVDSKLSKFERRETAYNLRDSENKLNIPLPHTNYCLISYREGLGTSL